MYTEYGNSILKFLRNCCTVFHKRIYIPTNRVQVPFLHILTTTCYLSTFWIFFFFWRIPALQYCTGFTAVWISHMHSCIYSWNLPPIPIPPLIRLGCYRAPGCYIATSTSYLFYIWQCAMSQYYSLCLSHPLLIRFLQEHNDTFELGYFRVFIY